MKKAIFFLLFPLCFHAHAQEQNDNSGREKEGFPKYKLFTGGGATLGLANGSTMIGVSPQFGMSVTDWMDAGVTFNMSFFSQNNPNSSAKVNQTTYGPGAFVRLFPLNFLFLSAQYEHNFMTEKTIFGGNIPDQTNHYGASSLLLGGGYAGGRQRGGNTYYFMSVSWDVLGDKNSPYVDYDGQSIVQFRVGYNIGLFQKSRR